MYTYRYAEQIYTVDPSVEDIINAYAPNARQARRGERDLLPVWIGSIYVVKLYHPDSLDHVVKAHEKLDALGRSARLIKVFDSGVVEEFISGIALDRYPADLSHLTIEGLFTSFAHLHPIEWDSNPENYILDSKTNTVKIIDLGDLFFGE